MMAIKNTGRISRSKARPKSPTVVFVVGNPGNTIAPIKEKRSSNKKTSRTLIMNRAITRSFRDVRPPKRVQMLSFHQNECSPVQGRTTRRKGGTIRRLLQYRHVNGRDWGYRNTHKSGPPAGVIALEGNNTEFLREILCNKEVNTEKPTRCAMSGTS